MQRPKVPRNSFRALKPGKFSRLESGTYDSQTNGSSHSNGPGSLHLGAKQASGNVQQLERVIALRGTSITYSGGGTGGTWKKVSGSTCGCLATVPPPPPISTTARSNCPAGPTLPPTEKWYQLDPTWKDCHYDNANPPKNAIGPNAGL